MNAITSPRSKILFSSCIKYLWSCLAGLIKVKNTIYHDERGHRESSLQVFAHRHDELENANAFSLVLSTSATREAIALLVAYSAQSLVLLEPSTELGKLAES